MRIGIYSPSWPGGADANGITTANLHLTAGLRSLGHEICILTPATNEKGSDIFPLPAAHKLSFSDRVRLRLGQAHVSVPYYADQVARAAQSAIAERGIDVLLIEETHGVAGMVQSRVAIPVVMVLHGPWFILSPLMDPAQREEPINRGRAEREAAGFQTCAALSAPSQAVLDTILATYALPQIPILAIPNPLPLKTPVDFKNLYPENHKSLLYVGRLDRLKGCDILLDGFARLIEGGADASLTIVGPDRGITSPNGTDTLSFEAYKNRLPTAASSRITWLGHREKAEIDDIRLRHPISLVTSRYETFGYTVLEPMAAGAATIATDVGGIPEIIEHGRNGLLIPPENVGALTTACVELLRNPATVQAMGARARETVAQRFLPEVVARQWEEFLGEVMHHWQASKA